MKSTKNPELIRGIGQLALIASVFNCTVGGGIFRLPSSVYAIVGDLSPYVYLICFAVMTLVAAVFVQVGSHIQQSGGPYAYVKPVLGSYAGFLGGVLLWALGTFAMASVANAYASFFGNLFPIFSSEMGQSFILVATLLFLAAINTKGVKQGAIASTFLSIAKLLPLLLVGIVGVASLGHFPMTTPEVIPWDGLSRGALLLIFAFTGIESALIPSGEIKDPKKTLPRALFGGLILILFLYLSLQIASQGILGDQLADTESFPLAEVGARLFGPNGRLLIELGAVLSTLGYLSAITLGLPRSIFAFAEDGYLPKFLAQVDSSSHTPKNAIWVQAVIASILAISNQFEKLAILANLSAILMYVLCAIAAFRVRKDTPARAVTALALFAMGFLLTAVRLNEWLAVLGLLAVSSILFLRKNRPGQI